MVVKRRIEPGMRGYGIPGMGGLEQSASGGGNIPRIPGGFIRPASARFRDWARETFTPKYGGRGKDVYFRGQRIPGNIPVKDLQSYFNPTLTGRSPSGRVWNTRTPDTGTSSFRGVRPYRNPHGGIGLHKGTKTGKGRPNPHDAIRNPATLMNMWWQRFKPWDIF